MHPRRRQNSTVLSKMKVKTLMKQLDLGKALQNNIDVEEDKNL